MRPNELGGQTLENVYELNAVTSALIAYGDAERAFRIIRTEPTEELHGNILPVFLEESQEVVRPLDTGDTEIVMQALSRVASGRLLVDHPLDELIAQSMVARFNDEDFVPKTNRFRKTFTKITKM